MVLASVRGRGEPKGAGFPIVLVLVSIVPPFIYEDSRVYIEEEAWENPW